MKEKLFYFPFYPADWLADTSVLTLEEKGAYITIIATMYLQDDCSLFKRHIPNILGIKHSLKKLSMLRKSLKNLITTSRESILNNLSSLSDLDSPLQKLCQLLLVLMALCHGWYTEYYRQSLST